VQYVYDRLDTKLQEGMKNSYKTFVGKPEGKTQLERPKGIWEDTANASETNGVLEYGLDTSGLHWVQWRTVFGNELSDSMKVVEFLD
jgi:hypothetical protein